MVFKKAHTNSIRAYITCHTRSLSARNEPCNKAAQMRCVIGGSRNGCKPAGRTVRVCWSDTPRDITANMYACREYVQRYLERSFYNHAALTPADWSTYCQLASLAHERLGLHVPAPALLEHKLSEGEPICWGSPASCCPYNTSSEHPPSRSCCQLGPRDDEDHRYIETRVYDYGRCGCAGAGEECQALRTAVRL